MIKTKVAMEPAAVTRSKSAPSRTTSTATKPPAMPDKVCPICCTATAKLVASAPACACHACHACVERWVAMQLPACRAKKQLRVKCFGCAKMMSQRTVLENSAAAADLACQLERREILQRNDLYPESVQVECRRAECVGIGYLGHATIMCMICEEQWSAEEMVVHAAIALDMQEVAKLSSGELASIKVGPSLTITVRKCPKCDIVTEKNGGCDHMRCARCSHEYYWSTGKAYH
ncbi:hypothetical protein EMIHUDRAFT_432650 [Emiliania huxleyi CCMP1516]|uniref:RING-type domain-containing protein n=2 Tax=Emiliania huxleyi TaxID=2903 RepID=A0A0D3IU63_EMIH1|nr:hypothetical protein EMIHUDRAFT_432650 [Emiliania huxleyi CCMP1516]EOD14798.1 hypothetical protein EMIHUDRAFT_432650 [Emiliania huxleyi CCMP1516]|eukprot:XP_005767227.1 hypothetical protein EMIHUDRAFT_432650 [Emiliania huxleyi CCMP1516]